MKKLALGCLVALAWMFSSIKCSADASLAASEPWLAQWIGISQSASSGGTTSPEPQTNLWSCFRKDFSFKYKNETYYENIEPNEFYPTYGSMYRVLLGMHTNYISSEIARVEHVIVVDYFLFLYIN